MKGIRTCRGQESVRVVRVELTLTLHSLREPRVNAPSEGQMALISIPLLLSISLAPPMFFHRIPTYYGVKVRRPLLKYFYQNTATPKTHHIYTEIHTELGRMMCACLYLKVWWCAVFALTPYMVRNLYDFYVYVYRKDNPVTHSSVLAAPVVV